MREPFHGSLSRRLAYVFEKEYLFRSNLLGLASTTGITRGTYRIRAMASTVLKEDVVDNTHTDGTVKTTRNDHLNGDGSKGTGWTANHTYKEPEA